MSFKNISILSSGGHNWEHLCEIILNLDKLK